MLHRIRPHLLFFALAAALLSTPLSAKPRHQRVGFQHFAGLQRGGYSIVGAEASASGESSLTIRTARNGRSASVAWKNTFYTSSGRHDVVLRWTFRPDGTFSANTIDPRGASRPATGVFTIDRNRPIPFTARSGDLTARGLLRLNGGGSVAATFTLSGLPEGEITCTFSGGRVR